MWRLVHQWSFLLFWLSFDYFWLFDDWYTVNLLAWYVLVDMWRLVHHSHFCCFDCLFDCFDDWYTVGTVLVDLWRMVLTVFDDWYSVKNSQNSKNDHWCTNRHMSTKTVPTTCNGITQPPLHALIHFFLEFNSWPWHTAITVFFLSASSFHQSYYVITPSGLDLTHSRGHS